jgi:hypothetical protein
MPGRNPFLGKSAAGSRSCTVIAQSSNVAVGYRTHADTTLKVAVQVRSVRVHDVSMAPDLALGKYSREISLRRVRGELSC